MKRIAKISLFALVLVILAGLATLTPGFRPPGPLQPVAHAADDPNTLTLDVALDFRTFTNTGLSPRGAVALGYGKVFPEGPFPEFRGMIPRSPSTESRRLGTGLYERLTGLHTRRDSLRGIAQHPSPGAPCTSS